MSTEEHAQVGGKSMLWVHGYRGKHTQILESFPVKFVGKKVASRSLTLIFNSIQRHEHIDFSAYLLTLGKSKQWKRATGNASNIT
jgi:hypothetical protein